jgi:signal transduction histidine kinase/AmiR/NasT family two-component response regulator/HPt (histidine-containing phosphotransfer) domain-containing protein
MEDNKLNILVIEDNDDHAELLRHYLKNSSDLTMTWKTTLRDGLSHLNNEDCDAVLLDLTLPEGNPRTTFYNLSKFVPDIPIIILSSLEDEELARSLFKNGAQDYLTKTQLSEGSINRSIRYAIERKNLQLQLGRHPKELERKNQKLKTLIEETTSKLTKSEKKYRSLVNNSPLGILIFDSLGNVEFSNPEFQKVFKYDKNHPIDVAEEANQAKTEFLTNISHEMRTPLTAISGFVDVISKRNRDKTLEPYLKTLRRNSKHLLFLVNDLLDLAKIESGQLETNISQFSLVEEIQSVIEMTKPLVVDQPIELSVKFKGLIPREIVTDLQKFRQIMLNLVNNAIKYTHKGEIKLDVTVKYYDTRGVGDVVIRVNDTGCGMNPKQKDQLFLPFVRVEEEVQKKEGLGIGLSLARKLAIALGGDIRLVKSTPGQGSTFEVRLPVGNFSNVAFYRPDSLLDSKTNAMSDRPPGTKADLSSKSILVVDDVHDIQFLIKTLLLESGVKMDILGNGREAVDRLKQQEYDLVLMDLQMPVLNGFDAIHEIRENGYHGKIVALTAHAFKTERDSCIKAGFDGFISKPFSHSQLTQSVTAFLNTNPTFEEISPMEKLSEQNIVALKEPLELFYNNLKKSIFDLSLANNCRDVDTLKKISHRLKGSSGCYGYPTISKISKKIETQSLLKANTFDSEAVSKYISNLDEERLKVKFDLDTKYN